MQRLPSKQRNTRVRRERDVRALSRLVLLLVLRSGLGGWFCIRGAAAFRGGSIRIPEREPAR